MIATALQTVSMAWFCRVVVPMSSHTIFQENLSPTMSR